MLNDKEQALILVIGVVAFVGLLVKPLLTLDLTLVALFLLAILEFGKGRFHAR